MKLALIGVAIGIAGAFALTRLIRTMLFQVEPFDPMSYVPWFSITLGHFQRGEYEAAAEAAQKVFQANPYWSSAHVLLAATHAKLGRHDAAKSAAARVLELEPDFTISGWCAAFDVHPSLAEPFSEALIAAGLPAPAYRRLPMEGPL